MPDKKGKPRCFTNTKPAPAQSSALLHSWLQWALQVRAATFLLLHPLRVYNTNAAEHGKAARVSSAVQGSSEQVPAAVKSIQFKRVLTGSSAPNKQQRLKAVDGAQQWFKTPRDSWALTGTRLEVWVLGFSQEAFSQPYASLRVASAQHKNCLGSGKASRTCKLWHEHQ